MASRADDRHADRAVEFFRLDTPASNPPTLAEEYRLEVWHPRRGRVIPPGCSGLKWWAWALFHYTGTFRSAQYGAVLIFRDGRLVHRSSLFPKYSRFPFMRDDDLQVGDTWTEPSERGRRLAVVALTAAARQALKPGARLWYLTTADNAASIRVAEAAGLVRAGTGVRTRRFGLRLLGQFRLSNGMGR